MERKYALRRVRAGDYLLFANDGRTLWRIQRYEDGPSHGLDPEVFPRDFTRWQASKWPRPVSERDRASLADSDAWSTEVMHLRTREEAIQYALTHSPGQGAVDAV